MELNVSAQLTYLLIIPIFFLKVLLYCQLQQGQCTLDTYCHRPGSNLRQHTRDDPNILRFSESNQGPLDKVHCETVAKHSYTKPCRLLSKQRLVGGLSVYCNLVAIISMCMYNKQCDNSVRYYQICLYHTLWCN